MLHHLFTVVLLLLTKYPGSSHAELCPGSTDVKADVLWVIDVSESNVSTHSFYQPQTITFLFFLILVELNAHTTGTIPCDALRSHRAASLF